MQDNYDWKRNAGQLLLRHGLMKRQEEIGKTNIIGSNRGDASKSPNPHGGSTSVKREY